MTHDSITHKIRALLFAVAFAVAMAAAFAAPASAALYTNDATLLVAPPIANPPPSPLPANTECIIISGGPAMGEWEKWKAEPHDKWWLNFIRGAELRITELRNLGVPGSQITWMVFAPGYEARARQEGLNLIACINEIAAKMGVKVRYFRKTHELIAYLNTGKPRTQVKIADLEYFGHSNKACWMFDYSNEIDSSSKVWLHEKELGQIFGGIFTGSAYVKSWGCHTGESMSQKFRRATRVKMWGATGRTQYMTHELPTLATPEGRWVQ